LTLNPSDRTIVLGSTQTLTEISTMSISWGYRRLVRKADNLPLSWNLGTLTSWNTLDRSRPVMGMLYLFFYCYPWHVCPAFCPRETTPAATGRIFVKFDIWVFFENTSSEFKFHYNINRITCYVHEDLRTFMTVSRWIIPRTRNISDKCCKENQNTYFMFRNSLPKLLPFIR